MFILSTHVAEYTAVRTVLEEALALPASTAVRYSDGSTSEEDKNSGEELHCGDGGRIERWMFG